MVFNNTELTNKYFEETIKEIYKREEWIRDNLGENGIKMIFREIGFEFHNSPTDVLKKEYGHQSLDLYLERVAKGLEETIEADEWRKYIHR